MMDLRYHISRAFARFLPDKLYLSIKFRSHMGYWMDWNNPQTFNEKIQWLKVYDRHPEYTKLVDKAAVKNYVASIIGEQYIIPTLAVYDSADSIDFDNLPNQFVLKCTHDSGGIVICRDKASLNKSAARTKLRKGLKRNYVIQNREYPYKNVLRRIIAEKYINDGDGNDIMDYKFFCFNGVPRFVELDFDRFTNHRRNVYDTKWNLLDLQILYPKGNDRAIPKPQNFDVMIEIAAKISIGIPHVRVDLYNVNGKIYFGEMTFFHGSGMESFTPQEWDLIFGKMIKLPKK